MSASFSIGERVRIAGNWFDAPLRGATGKIAAAPTGVADKRDSGICWVEFEEPWPGGESENPVDAAEVDVAFLRPA